MGYAPVLQLNADGKPLAIIDWAKAVRKLRDGKAVLVAQDPDRACHSEKWSTPQPLIIMLPQYAKLDHDKIGRQIHMRRRVVYARDNWTCQYCGVEVTPATASIDHVKPVSLFKKEGKTRSDANVWENVVTSCKPCNHKKADRLPMECGMYPRRAPKKPGFVNLWAGKHYHPVQAKYVAEVYGFDERRLRVTSLRRDFDWDRALLWK